MQSLYWPVVVLFHCFHNLIVLVSDARDVDAKEKIADLETKIVELEKQNAGLKNKVKRNSMGLYSANKVVCLLLWCT